jgi:hypothetical protein
MLVSALASALIERCERRSWAIALVPAVFALLTSADLAPFFAATWMFAPEVMAVVALPLLVLLLVRSMGRQSVGSLQQVLVAKAGHRGRNVATAAGLASFAALVASSIDLGALSALITALGAVGDLGIWLWVLAAGIPEIAIIAAVLVLGRTMFRFAVRIAGRRGGTR